MLFYSIVHSKQKSQGHVGNLTMIDVQVLWFPSWFSLTDGSESLCIWFSARHREQILRQIWHLTPAAGVTLSSDTWWVGKAGAADITNPQLS